MNEHNGMKWNEHDTILTYPPFHHLHPIIKQVSIVKGATTLGNKAFSPNLLR